MILLQTVPTHIQVKDLQKKLLDKVRTRLSSLRRISVSTVTVHMVHFVLSCLIETFTFVWLLNFTNLKMILSFSFLALTFCMCTVMYL